MASRSLLLSWIGDFRAPLSFTVCGRGSGRKIVGAAAASILTAAYHMIANGAFYEDLGADHFERRAKPNQIQRLVAKIQGLGYDVEIKPTPA